MAATTSVSTVTAWDKNGKKVQCDQRQFKALLAKGYSLTDPALNKEPAEAPTAPAAPKTATAKPAVKK